METGLDIDQLLADCRRRGFAFAFRMLGNADNAADAVQEALSVLWAQRGRLERGRDPAAWFFRVLRNHCIDQLRKGTARRHEPIEATNLADPRMEGPDVIAQHDEFKKRLSEELDRLDAQYREIVLLRDEQGLSYAQIADVLGIAQGTVMSRLHRARTMLRERLKDLL